MKKPRISEDAERDRETYRCEFCGKFTGRDDVPFYDREDRADDSSGIRVFCSEAHADAYHAKRTAKHL